MTLCMGPGSLLSKTSNEHCMHTLQLTGSTIRTLKKRVIRKTLLKNFSEALDIMTNDGSPGVDIQPYTTNSCGRT